MMNNQGFPKSPRFYTITGVETDLAEPCAEGVCHDFKESSGMMQKTDAGTGEHGVDEMVVLRVFVCRYCLLHAYIELQRIPMTPDPDPTQPQPPPPSWRM